MKDVTRQMVESWWLGWSVDFSAISVLMVVFGWSVGRSVNGFGLACWLVS